MALKMKADHPTYYDEAKEWKVAFYPIKNLPGFTHKVVINGSSAGWLGSHTRPSATNAAYFLERFGPYIVVMLQRDSQKAS